MQFVQPIYILAILFALSIHEWAHAFAADKLGDPTAREQGRLTVNPIAHLDPLGSLLFLMIGFGWGKPVPVDPRYFRRPRLHMALVAGAGPLSNLILAFIAFLVLFFYAGTAEAGAVPFLLDATIEGTAVQAFLIKFLASSIFVNLGLMAFNLLPVAPLDGSKILAGWIPARHELRYEEFMRVGPYILLGLLVAERLMNVSLLSTWIMFILMWILRTFDVIVGVFA